MKRLCILALPILATGIVSGCGDPAPSTTLAPDKAMPDVSKMSDADIAKMRQQDHAGDRK